MINQLIVSPVTHKHLGIILDSKLSFDKHLNSVLGKIRKTVGLLQNSKAFSLQQSY